jgi:hypothetical protein
MKNVINVGNVKMAQLLNEEMERGFIIRRPAAVNLSGLCMSVQNKINLQRPDRF